MELVLTYNFHECWRDGRESIRVDVDNFKYKINVSDGYNYEAEKKKYYQDALELAAYEEMCNYADVYF